MASLKSILVPVAIRYFPEILSLEYPGINFNYHAHPQETTENFSASVEKGQFSGHR